MLMVTDKICRLARLRARSTWQTIATSTDGNYDYIPGYLYLQYWLSLTFIRIRANTVDYWSKQGISVVFGNLTHRTVSIIEGMNTILNSSHFHTIDIRTQRWPREFFLILI
jgi:hypothetical protein